MWVYFSKISRMDENYKEVLIDRFSFSEAKYTDLSPMSFRIGEEFYDDLYLLESHYYYRAEIESTSEITRDSLKNFVPDFRFENSGITVSVSFKEEGKCYAYLYNKTNNPVFLKSDMFLGVIE